MRILPDFFYKEQFKMPSWLKPEINTIVYHIHIWILAAVALGVLQYFYGGNMLTIKNVLISWPILTLSDGIAHSILQLD